MPANRPAPWSHSNTINTVPVRAFSPGDLTGLVAWYDAKDIVGIADGGSVNSWPDASGNGRTANQFPAVAVPTYKVNAVNGSAAVLFDGTMTLQASVTGLTLTPPFTVICIAQNQQTTNDGVEHTIWDFTSGGNEYCFRAMYTSSNQFELIGPAGFGGMNTTIPSTDGAWRLWATECHPTIPWARTQGRLDSTAPVTWSGLSISGGALNIGSRVSTQRPWKGYIMAVLVYNRALTPWEHHRISQYYAPRIGITYTPHLPTDVSGLKLWLAADQITGLQDGNPVTQWNDLSGVGNHFTVPNGAVAPVFWSKGLLGYPVVRFDGSTQWLSKTPLVTSLSPPFTLAAAFMARNGPSQNEGLFGATANDSALTTINGGPPNSAMTLYDGPGLIGGPSNVQVDVPTTVVAVNNGTATNGSYVSQNGVRGTAGTMGGTTWTGLLLGRRSSEAGVYDVLDGILYGAAIADVDWLKVEDYLRRRILI